MDENIAPGVPPHWLPYIAVADVDAEAATARKEGGDLLTPPADVASNRRIAVVRDPQGAVFGIYRAGDEGCRPARPPRTGSAHRARPAPLTPCRPAALPPRGARTPDTGGDGGNQRPVVRGRRVSRGPGERRPHRTGPDRHDRCAPLPAIRFRTASSGPHRGDGWDRPDHGDRSDDW